MSNVHQHLKTDGTTIKFACIPGGLYGFQPWAPYIAANKACLQGLQTLHKDATSLLVSTIKENYLGYIACEFDHAKAIRKTHHIVGAPTTGVLCFFHHYFFRKL